MTGKSTENELPEDMTEDEFKNIHDFLLQYDVKYPDPDAINRTVEAARFQMRLKARPKLRLWMRMQRVLRLAASELSMMSPLYWIVSAALYVSGFMMIGFKFHATPAFSLFALAPLPFILGLMEVFRSRDERMLELEMSCVFNAASVMLSKLSMIGVYNILLNSLCSLWLIRITEQTHLWDITLLWMTPFTLISGLSLVAAIHLRGSTAVLFVMTLWLSFCLILIFNPILMRNLLTMHTASYLLLIGFGIMLTVMQVSRLLKRTMEMEGMVEFETDH
ncbi:hypothetical protein [Paenibacillus eucommiae]|uniref:DUF1700 domain-containing protein n=1 Tax=Paenibacillus eucommiae TaxID=1355755 RepID=A0ABS4J7D2_9BACL|nr:hypothetical protein [Paenibacillus eucommiae]MBP1995170.1 hypothetical protein [Paenibacillus eucommiae]